MGRGVSDVARTYLDTMYVDDPGFHKAHNINVSTGPTFSRITTTNMMTRNVALAVLAFGLLPWACFGFAPPTTRQLQEQKQLQAFRRLSNSRILMSQGEDVSEIILFRAVIHCKQQ